MSFVTEPERKTPIAPEAEVVVLGGGPAGIAAAAAAARLGRQVVLVERYGFLGGMGTAAGVTNFCGLHANVFGEIKQVVHGVADVLLARIDALGGLNEPHLVLGKTYAQAYDTAAYKLAADDLLGEMKVHLQLHALAAGAIIADEKRIDALLIETKSGRMAIRGKIFIDCSGDGDLAAFAGAAYEKGDMLYPSMMFRVANVDAAKAGEAWRTIPELMRAAEARGAKFPRKGAIVRPQKHTSEWRVNVTQVKHPDGRAIDGTDANELAMGELLGRKQAFEFYSFLTSDVPGFEDAYIVDIPPQLGIRETRRIIGAYRLTAEDVIGCASFDDTIGVNGWPLEMHVAVDVVWRWPEIPGSRGYNHLPYRMLTPLNAGGQTFDNLLVAGRCASMTHEGQSAARVSGACFVMGEAAGTAAHLALTTECTCPDISIGKLQELLESNGAFLGRD
jgi:glycine/D-amino acid oxidase-like deaminating enzyme